MSAAQCEACRETGLSTTDPAHACSGEHRTPDQTVKRSVSRINDPKESNERKGELDPDTCRRARIFSFLGHNGGDFLECSARVIFRGVRPNDFADPKHLVVCECSVWRAAFPIALAARHPVMRTEHGLGAPNCADECTLPDRPAAEYLQVGGRRPQTTSEIAQRIFEPRPITLCVLRIPIVYRSDTESCSTSPDIRTSFRNRSPAARKKNPRAVKNPLTCNTQLEERSFAAVWITASAMRRNPSKSVSLTMPGPRLAFPLLPPPLQIFHPRWPRSPKRCRAVPR